MTDNSRKFEFKIRQANEDDVPGIVELVKELAHYENLEKEVSGTIDLFKKHGFSEHPYYESILAEYSISDETKLVGFALYFYTFSTFLGKPTLFLEDLFVRPEYRGRGVGKSLLVRLAHIARQKHCGRMEWAVLNWNEPSIEFYKQLGAVAMSEWTTFRLDKQALKALVNL
jgi:GNAT superfamily N-acetyltransferase